MSWKIILRLIELAVTFVLAASLFLAWRAERNDRAKLVTELAAAQQSLTQATDRQQSRDADLFHTLASLAAQKRSVQTPEQVLQALPQQIPLPQPLVRAPVTEPPPYSPTVNPANPGTAANSNLGHPPNNNEAKPAAPEPQLLTPKTSQPQAIIPTADLKPLYDFALDCKACQAKLAASQSDLADERAKTATLTKERDAAIRTAKGGSALQRAARAAKWLLIGAAAGTMAARAVK